MIEEVIVNDGEDGNGNGNGKVRMRHAPNPFHVFQVSIPPSNIANNNGDNVPPLSPSSILVTNWLMGLFEPQQPEPTQLITTPGLRVYRNGEEVPITSTIVTTTIEMNLIGLYKIFKPGYDEVFFVVSKSGNPKMDAPLTGEVCEYDNVLCLEPAEVVLPAASSDNNSDQVLREMVHHLTGKFFQRFGAFFQAMETLEGNEESAVARLTNVAAAIAQSAGNDVVVPVEMNNPSPKIKQKGNQEVEVVQPIGPQGRLFYCGSTGSGKNINHSILGIFLANAFFPEIVGGPPNTGREEGGEEKVDAILLTPETLGDANVDDILVFHMHQYCGVDVLAFPGRQLHINHPTNGFNAYGRYTPPSDNVFVIGPHEEGPHSIQLPYAMMKWWVLVKGLGSNGENDLPTMEKFFIPAARPKNTGKHFLLYVNSHYVAHREMAAFTLSQLKPMHAMGSCQGNIQAVPEMSGTSRAPRCQPYPEELRPDSVIVPGDSNRESNYFNRVTFQDFRFMLLFEDYNLPGYITDRIVDGFMSGTVPIYYGTEQVFDVFNPKAFIYYDINNPQEALDRIQFLEENPNAYQEMLNVPILADGERTIEKYFSFDDSIGNGMLKRRVRKKFGFPI